MIKSRQIGKWRFGLTAAIAMTAIAAVSLSVWYHIPVKKHTTIMVFNLEDNENYENVRLDLVISRSFVFPTEIGGEMQFGEATYIPWIKEDIGFLQKLLKKINGEIVTPVWINASNIGDIGVGEEIGKPLGISQNRMLSDLIYIQQLEFDGGGSAKTLSLLKTSDGSSMWCSDQ